jgi:RNA polymerase sigma factor (sigma-70 family)
VPGGLLKKPINVRGLRPLRHEAPRCKNQRRRFHLTIAYNSGYLPGSATLDVPMRSVDNLVSRARQGDREAEAEIYQYLFERFASLAKRRIGSKEDAEDLAQEACVTVIEKYRSETFTKGFAAWAYGVLRNKIGNYLQLARVKQRHLPLHSSSGVAGQRSNVQIDTLLRRNLIECLRRLAKSHLSYARVLNLVHQGFTTGEICSRLRITPNQMYVTLSRGRSLMEECLDTGRIKP